jgi:hypothetical protein
MPGFDTNDAGYTKLMHILPLNLGSHNKNPSEKEGVGIKRVLLNHNPLLREGLCKPIPDEAGSAENGSDS